MPVLLLSNVKQNVDNPLEIFVDLTFERFRETLYDVHKNIQKSDSSWQFLNSRVYVLQGWKHNNFSEPHRLTEVVPLAEQARDRPISDCSRCWNLSNFLQWKLHVKHSNRRTCSIRRGTLAQYIELSPRATRLFRKNDSYRCFLGETFPVLVLFLGIGNKATLDRIYSHSPSYFRHLPPRLITNRAESCTKR